MVASADDLSHSSSTCWLMGPRKNKHEIICCCSGVIIKIIIILSEKPETGPNGIPYLLYKKCPRVLKILHMLVESAWETGRVDNEWKRAEGVYIPKEKDSRSLTQFRPISLLNMEGKVFFTIMASRFTQYVMSNRYIDTTIRKGAVPGVPGCIEHTTMIWESIQQARRNRLSLYVM